MWGHAEEETTLRFCEAANFLQPCLLCACSCGLAAGIAVCVADVLQSCRAFPVDEEKSFLGLFKVPKRILRHFILHVGGCPLRYLCLLLWCGVTDANIHCLCIRFCLRAVKKVPYFVLNEVNCSPVGFFSSFLYTGVN